jgi:hypothetical protein
MSLEHSDGVAPPCMRVATAGLATRPRVRNCDETRRRSVTEPTVSGVSTPPLRLGIAGRLVVHISDSAQSFHVARERACHAPAVGSSVASGQVACEFLPSTRQRVHAPVRASSPAQPVATPDTACLAEGSCSARRPLQHSNVSARVGCRHGQVLDGAPCHHSTSKAARPTPRRTGGRGRSLAPVFDRRAEHHERPLEQHWFGEVPSDDVEWLPDSSRSTRARYRSYSSPVLLAPPSSEYESSTTFVDLTGIAPASVPCEGNILLLNDRPKLCAPLSGIEPPYY